MAAPTSLDDYREQENARRWGLVMIGRLGNACPKGSACGCFSALAQLTDAEWRRAAAEFGAERDARLRMATWTDADWNRVRAAFHRQWAERRRRDRAARRRRRQQRAPVTSSPPRA